MAKETITSSPADEFIMFASSDGEVRVECRFEQETLWLPQATIASLNQVTPKPLHGILKRSMRKASLSKTQPVSLTYKFNKKIAVRDQFRQFNDRDVLQGAGKVSKKMADETAPKK